MKSVTSSLSLVSEFESEELVSPVISITSTVSTCFAFIICAVAFLKVAYRDGLILCSVGIEACGDVDDKGGRLSGSAGWFGGG